MTRYVVDGARAELLLFTFKEGLLSRVAHDLRFRAGELRGAAEVEGDRVRCELEVPVAALRVEGQVKRGAVTPLKPKDHREIEESLRSPKVLDAGRHPGLAFAGEGVQQGQRLPLSGRLTLRGVERPLAVEVSLLSEGDGLRARGEVELRQRDWGIQPFSALMGALKVQDRVRISFDLPLLAENEPSA